MPRFKDITGLRFGRLKAEYRVEGNGRPAWLCQCECGKQCVVVGESLRSGNTRSCGCLRRELNSRKIIDHAGTGVGAWTVIKRTGSHPSGETLWLCECVCGTEGLVRGSQLKWARSLSCGCNRRRKFRRA